MSEKTLSGIEKAHITIQIIAQIFTIVAAIAVAIWGLYSTIYVKKEKLFTEYTLKELDQKTTQKPHIQAKVESTIQPLAAGQNLLQIKVIISNIGNKESKVSLDKDALSLVPVVFNEGEPRYKKPIYLLNGRYLGTLNRTPLNFINIGAGESYEVTFVHVVENPGVYLIHLLALNGIEPTEKDSGMTGGLPFQYAVGVDQYVVVE